MYDFSFKEYKNCKLCPKKCSINRINQTGMCHATSALYVARAALHFWEEPCIYGVKGSGTIFFSGCNLRCIYCQNHEISSGQVGKIINLKRLVEIFFELKEKGANNINLVTPTHFLPHIRKAIKYAKNNNIELPFVYNSSGYESVDSLQTLNGLINIYLTDFKYCSAKLSFRYSRIKNYFTVALNALKEMTAQTGNPKYKNNLMQSGTIVRHLVLPGHEQDSKKIIKALLPFKDKIVLSIMNQYTPIKNAILPKELQCTVKKENYEEILNYADKLGFDALYQESGTVNESFIPPFDLKGV